MISPIWPCDLFSFSSSEIVLTCVPKQGAGHATVACESIAAGTATAE